MPPFMTSVSIKHVVRDHDGRGGPSVDGLGPALGRLRVKVEVDDGGIPAHEHAVADRNAVGRHERGPREATVFSKLRNDTRAAGGGHCRRGGRRGGERGQERSVRPSPKAMRRPQCRWMIGRPKIFQRLPQSTPCHANWARTRGHARRRRSSRLALQGMCRLWPAHCEQAAAHRLLHTGCCTQAACSAHRALPNAAATHVEMLLIREPRSLPLDGRP